MSHPIQEQVNSPPALEAFWDSKETGRDGLCIRSGFKHPYWLRLQYLKLFVLDIKVFIRFRESDVLQMKRTGESSADRVRGGRLGTTSGSTGSR